jgi:hypothetical protein
MGIPSGDSIEFIVTPNVCFLQIAPNVVMVGRQSNGAPLITAGSSTILDMMNGVVHRLTNIGVSIEASEWLLEGLFNYD